MVAAIKSIRPDTLRRGLGLIRVSKDRDGMTSPEVQRYSIEQHAERNGIAIVEWVEGLDESGSDAKSAWWPKLDSSVDRVVAGEVDVIVVWKFSRVGRRRVRWAIALDRVDTAGGSIESATEQADASPSGRLQRGLMGEFNAYQAELIGETWRETHERRIRSGLPPTGGGRFGYVISDGAYEPNPVTGPVLREVYQLYLAGWGHDRLAQYLSDNDPSGRVWSRPGLVGMLDSGFAAGLLGHSEVVGGTRRAPKPWKRRYSTGAHQALIDVETWRAYVAAREKRNGSRVRSPSSPYMLSGLVRCGDCGGAMHGKRTNGRYTYTCTRAERTGGVRKVSIVAWRADEVAERWLFTLSHHTDEQLAARVGHTAKRSDTEAFARRANARIQKGEERLAALAIKLADGILTDAAYGVAAASIQQDIDAAQAVVRAAVVNPAEERAPAKLPRDLVTMWPMMAVEQRNLLLRPLLAYVFVAPAAHRGDKGDRCVVVPSWEVDSVGT